MIYTKERQHYRPTIHSGNVSVHHYRYQHFQMLKFSKLGNNSTSHQYTGLLHYPTDHGCLEKVRFGESLLQNVAPIT